MRLAIQGAVDTYFVGLVHVKRGDVEGVFGAIKHALNFEDLPSSEVMKKIVGFTCDGASANTGKNRGVIELMQEEVHDKVVLVHCLVHRLELAY